VSQRKKRRNKGKEKRKKGKRTADQENGLHKVGPS
jgi:hypothetical protein